MTLILFSSLFILLILGVPIAVCLGLAALIIFFLSGIPLIISVQTMYSGIDSFPLMAIPFFILAGNIMSSGGISRRLIKFASMLVGKIRGGLAMVAIFSSMFFASISGSSPATVAAIGGVMIPEMKRKKYDENFAGATVAAAGIVGQVIPPSIPMVVYAVLAGTSVTKMFIAGIVPGILMSLTMALVAHWYAKKQNIPLEVTRYSFKERIKIFADSFWALLMPVIILGGIYRGIFTPTEAAVVAVFYGLVVGLLIYKELKIKDIPDILSKSSIATAVIMIIMASAYSFGWVLTSERIPQLIADSLLSLTSNKYLLLLIFNIILLIVGTFLNPTAAIVLLTPILLPVLISVGLDPIMIGVIMIVNLAIGQITPPVGVDLYIASNIGNLKFEKLVKAIVPYLLGLIFTLMVITYFEPLTMIFIK